MLGENAAWLLNVRASAGEAVLRHGIIEPVILQEVPVSDGAPGARPHFGIPPTPHSETLPVLLPATLFSASSRAAPPRPSKPARVLLVNPCVSLRERMHPFHAARCPSRACHPESRSRLLRADEGSAFRYAGASSANPTFSTARSYYTTRTRYDLVDASPGPCYHSSCSAVVVRFSALQRPAAASGPGCSRL